MHSDAYFPSSYCESNATLETCDLCPSFALAFCKVRCRAHRAPATRLHWAADLATDAHVNGGSDVSLLSHGGVSTATSFVRGFSAFLPYFLIPPRMWGKANEMRGKSLASCGSGVGRSLYSWLDAIDFFISFSPSFLTPARRLVVVPPRSWHIL